MTAEWVAVILGCFGLGAGIQLFVLVARKGQPS